MNVGYATVTETAHLYADTYETWFRAPELAHGAYPGQFIMLRCSDDQEYGAPEGDLTSHLSPPASQYDPLLPRPMSYYRVRETKAGPEWGILYDVVGRGTAWLANRKPGDRVYAWGPLGRGYEIGRNSRNLLLVAGGIGVSPLVWLADEACAKGLSVTMIVGARDASRIIPASMLHPQVELVVTTDDGSAGRRGLVTEPFAELYEWCDQAFACGPNVMMQAMAAVARKQKVRRSVQVLLEERMGCGTGICYGCAVEVRVRGGRSMKLVCKDGPRFEARDVW
ncbi:MAG: dihydroorotate dehydrogenase electron transfer subunit [Chloroflexi bacterium]|nr:dihydroorotate dehydrogenase electron transfer subunit [Chloroflexota bacterium]